MKHTLGLAALSVALLCSTAQAQQINVKIGVLSDMSSLYADIGGPGSTAAAKMAIADFMAANRDGTRNLVEAVARVGTGRLVFVSSMAAAGPTIKGRPLRGDEAPRPVTAYGRSKLAAEEIVLGAWGDGGGGSDGSDLQQATALATALEVSLGLGNRLAYLSPRDDAELLSRLRGRLPQDRRGADPGGMPRTRAQNPGRAQDRAGETFRASQPARAGLADGDARRPR